MRLAVMSDTRLPTLPDGPHGLGRSAHDIATGLAERGHGVTLFAGPGSAFTAGGLVAVKGESAAAALLASGEQGAFDAILDTSHRHSLSRAHPDLPVVNRMADRECDWSPPNAAINSDYMLGLHPNARKVATGVRVGEIPFYPTAGGYLVYMSGRAKHKGGDTARQVASASNRPLREAQNLTGAAKWNHLGNGLALLHPSTIDAAPRTPLEAAACGVPTLCLDGDGAQEHVENGLTGFVCGSADEMTEHVIACRVSAFDRKRIRGWAADTHGFEQMVGNYERLLVSVAEGERW